MGLVFDIKQLSSGVPQISGRVPPPLLMSHFTLHLNGLRVLAHAPNNHPGRGCARAFPSFTPPKPKRRRGQNAGGMIQVPQLFILIKKKVEVHVDAEITPIHLGLSGSIHVNVHDMCIIVKPRPQLIKNTLNGVWRWGSLYTLHRRCIE